MKSQYLLLLLLFSSYSMADKLSIERIYAEPELAGSAPVQLKLSPDGKRVSYLKPATDDFLRLDLWEYNIAAKTNRLLVDAKQLVPDEGELSDVEKARRERQRIGNTGIVEYAWSKQGDALLFPLGGDIYYYKVADRSVKQLTQTEAFETDSRFSPQGNYISFIRNKNIFIVDIASGKETAITTEGGGLISFGMAEFIAQEEMDRDTGYWWSDDESGIAFTWVDESPVGVEQRYEIYADELKVYNQRYPKTGTPNAEVKVGIADVKSVINTSKPHYTWVNFGTEKDVYIPRVKWLPDNETLAVQRQTRDQTILDLLFANRSNGETRVVLREKNNFWVRLHHSLLFLKQQNAFVWGSDRSGYHHLGLYDYDGNLLKTLTSGEWEVTELLGLDEKKQTLYFMANALTPLEQHLYSVKMDGEGVSQPKQLTTRSGWHEIEFSDDKKLYVDRFSNTITPPQVSLHQADGDRLTFLDENTVDEDHPYFSYQEHHVKPEFGYIRASDDQRLYYQLFRPTTLEINQKYPVVIEVYGGPGVQRVRNAWTNPWHQHLVQNGYVVFLLENRGATNRGRNFETPIYHHLGKVEVEDQQAGVRFLRSLSYVDSDNIGIFGWSYGGYMALMTLLKAPEDFAVAVSVAPVTDWTLYDTHYTERYLGTPKDNAAGYDASSVFPYVDNLKNPLMIIHGMADDNVLFSNSTKLFSELQAKDLPFEMMTYPGAKHGIRGKMVRRHLYKAATAFFDKNLKQ
jgi:dipeptidyl-peptidase-4